MNKCYLLITSSLAAVMRAVKHAHAAELLTKVSAQTTLLMAGR